MNLFSNKSIKLCKSEEHLLLVQCSRAGCERGENTDVSLLLLSDDVCVCVCRSASFSTAVVWKVKSDHSAGSAETDTPD